MKIEIHIRDINGHRKCWIFKDEGEFSEAVWPDDFDDNYQIMMVIWDEHCVYNALSQEEIILEDLIGFFA